MELLKEYEEAKRSLRRFVRTGRYLYIPILKECGAERLEVTFYNLFGRQSLSLTSMIPSPVEARQRLATLAVRLLDEYVQQQLQHLQQEQQEETDETAETAIEPEKENEELALIEGFDVVDEDAAESFGGGGPGIIPSAAAPAVARELRALFEKLAFERAPYGRTDERERWDARLLVRGRFIPNRIPVAKSGREVDHEIYFVLDDSGSMAPYAEMFAALLEASRHVVRVYTGSEAHPQDAADGSYRAPYRHSFADQLEEWLTAVRPAPGSVLIFWGDTCDMHVRGEEARVRRLLRPYRAYWLGTYIQDDYSGWEQPCLPAAGFRVIAPVTTPAELRAAVKRIK